MEMWSEIRREVLTGALSKRAAIAKYGVGWHTLKKMLAHDEPPGYRQAKHRPKPKLEPFLPVIRQILEDDGKAPTKQKHTARWIFERLHDGVRGSMHRRFQRRSQIPRLAFRVPGFVAPIVGRPSWLSALAGCDRGLVTVGEVVGPDDRTAVDLHLPG